MRGALLQVVQQELCQHVAGTHAPSNLCSDVNTMRRMLRLSPIPIASLATSVSYLCMVRGIIQVHTVGWSPCGSHIRTLADQLKVTHIHSQEQGPGQVTETHAAMAGKPLTETKGLGVTEG